MVMILKEKLRKLNGLKSEGLVILGMRDMKNVFVALSGVSCSKKLLRVPAMGQ